MPGEISRTYDGPGDPEPTPEPAKNRPLIIRPLPDGDDEMIKAMFLHHPPTGNKGDRHNMVRSYILGAARNVLAVCPHSPERTEAIKKMREAMFWANAAIACNPEVPG